MSHRPVFSVVIPTYNRANIIRDAIDSIQKQTFSKLEIIVVDDGSTDGTQSVVESIDDDRVRYIKQSNSGGSRARNVGIDSANGNYIAFLDSDDKFLPCKLEKVLHAIQQNEADIYFSSVIVDRGGGVTSIKPYRGPNNGEPIDEYLFTSGGTIQTSSIVLKAEIAKSVRFLDGLKKGQDLDFVLRLYKSGAKFYYVNEPLAIWCDYGVEGRVSHTNHAGNLSHWLEQSRSLMSSKAYYGFRANILSYEISRHNPLKAVLFILAGYLFGGISFKRTLHSTGRALIHQRVYRFTVNLFLSFRNR